MICSSHDSKTTRGAHTHLWSLLSLMAAAHDRGAEAVPRLQVEVLEQASGAGV